MQTTILLSSGTYLGYLEGFAWARESFNLYL